MKFRELFQDVEDWFWKLEFNPESLSYELYMGIPNDWVYSEKNGLITIELIHQLEENSIVKVSSNDYEVSIDDIIDTAKALISKNQELEKRKQQHKEEMENLAKILVEKEKSFLEYVDTVKENTLKSIDAVNNVVEKVEGVNDGENDGVNDGENEGVNDGENFLKDIEKLKLK
jgi:vacuolar-type H+-ATPase subunit I/STV1